ncbi:G2 M phase-specific E3 ubiquitin- ligase-like [Paramuricea clavata]|uniref:G2 M phase-specific E3 ubiquitin- ligase-like n=1 Tax=Paramuricea clavata TaxID=317549 RepID=A0A6S7KUV3_PARCT|nr:G2 M phase-specific E3 ubiquitin- ligase-like [Paramuricea clavata]
MFPNTEANTIIEALESANGCVETATFALLNDDGLDDETQILSITEIGPLSTEAANNDDDPNLITLPASITITDIPDLDLRGYIQELENLTSDVEIPSNLKEDILPYLLEAGLDLNDLNINRKHVIQGIMIHFVIDKRKRELDDLAKGMDEVGLHRFIGRCESKNLESIFPMCDQMFISYEELKEQMVFEDTEGREETITYWHNYLACLSKYEPGQLSLTDLCCFWTATNTLPPRSSTLLVKFNDDQSELPTAETCFNSLTLPTIHTSYDNFRRSMDTALRNGSMGIDLS